MSEFHVVAEPRPHANDLEAAWAGENIVYEHRVDREGWPVGRAHGSMPFLGEFFLQSEFIVAAVGAAGGWLAARQGRRIRIKLPNGTEAEATSVQELRDAMTLIAKHAGSKGSD